MTEAEGLHRHRHLSLTASLTVLVLHRHGVKYYNNTSAPKNVVVAEDFLKTLPLSLYIAISRKVVGKSARDNAERYCV